MRPCTLHCQVPQAGMERCSQVLEWLGCQKPNGHSLDLQNQSAWKNVWGSWHSTCFSLKHVHINPSSVIVSHFLDTSMIVQVESIRHLSYCLQAESCKWQVQPSPLLLGRESRHGFKTDIGVEMILDGQRWSLLFFFFHFFSPGHLRTTSTWTWTHRISEHKKVWAKPDDSRLRWRGVTCWRGFRQGWFVLNLFDYEYEHLFLRTRVGIYKMNKNDLCWIPAFLIFFESIRSTVGYSWILKWTVSGARRMLMANHVPKVCVHPFSRSICGHIHAQLKTMWPVAVGWKQGNLTGSDCVLGIPWAFFSSGIGFLIQRIVPGMALRSVVRFCLCIGIFAAFAAPLPSIDDDTTCSIPEDK